MSQDPRLGETTFTNMEAMPPFHLRVAKWATTRPGLHLCMWVVSALAWRVDYIVNSRQGGAPAAVRYVFVAASLAASLTLTTPFPVPALLTFPLLAVYSFSSPPQILGYGGQVALFALRTTLILNIIVGFASFRMKRCPASDKLLRRLVAAHLALALATLGLTGGFSLLPEIQHRGERISVHALTVQSRRLGSAEGYLHIVSMPFIDGSSAFVATQAGVLHEIDLDSGRVVRKIQLPMPEPNEVGLKRLVKYPGDYSASHTAQAVISRLSSDRLSVIYPYLVGIGTEYGWGLAQTSYRIDVEVDLTAGAIAHWALAEAYMPEQEPREYEVKIGECTVTGGGSRGLRISGPSIDTLVHPPTDIDWLKACGTHALATTRGGRVYVINVPDDLVPDTPEALHFNFSNYEEALDAFGPPGNEGKATVVIDDYIINHFDSCAGVNLAKLVRVVDE